MKIDFSDYDLNEFNVTDIEFCDIFSTLIFPKNIGIKFTQKNSIFRSSIWDKETGELLSAGLKKFTNFGENPENFPVPLSIDGVEFVTKIDGSLCICDFVNNQISMRTRGTSTYKKLENYLDFEYCLSKHPKIIDWLKNNSNYSLLLEITTPRMKIVIDYGNEPLFWLVGAVNKNDYSLMPQRELDKLANDLGVNRPETYTFDSIESAISTIEKWDGKEGVCLYSKNSSVIHKLKAEVYLRLHRFKSEATLDNTVEMYVAMGCPSFNDFIQQLTVQIDYECMLMVRGFASRVVDAKKEADKIVNHMMKFVEPYRKQLVEDNPVFIRLVKKDAAKAILGAYGKTNRSGFCFTLLNGKTLGDADIKKLIYQILK